MIQFSSLKPTPDTICLNIDVAEVASREEEQRDGLGRDRRGWTRVCGDMRGTGRRRDGSSFQGGVQDMRCELNTTAGFVL